MMSENKQPWFQPWLHLGRDFFFFFNATEHCNNLNHVPAWLVHSCMVKNEFKTVQNRCLTRKSWPTTLKQSGCAVSHSFSPAKQYSCGHAKSPELASTFILKWRPRREKKAILHQACSQVVSVPLAWIQEQHRGLLNVTEETRVAGDKDSN